MSEGHNFGGPNPIGGPAGQPPPSPPPPAPLPPPPPPPPQAPPPPPQTPWQQPYPDYPQGPEQFAGPPQYQYANQFGPGQIQPRPPKRRKGLLIGVGAAAAVVVLVVAGVLIFNAGGGGGGGAETPGQAVQGYLDALARGDAEAALSFVAQVPPDKTFLTDEILKKQIEKYPITNITILGENPSAKGATVAVRADFGGKTSDQQITLPAATDGDWKLQHGVTSVDANIANMTSKKLVEMVTIFGKPIPKTGKAYLFPGWVEFGSSNPNIEIAAYKDEPPTLQEIWLGHSMNRPEFGISEAGQKAIRDQLKKMSDECARSTQLEPPDCPNDFKISGVTEGTAKWTAPTSFDGIEADFLDPRTATVRLYGSTEWGITVQTDRGPYSTTTTAYLMGEADMTQDPPKITLER
ncbi:DUF4878 domain-containing protein [Mycolicibacterium flavescens]|uniref:Uncharacterized protein n=1 Tax=Mycolicibacterium flavescens TaxID=1776 RepID=A0A1E3RLU8_MYCFV|nr:DUF4878 domain-containing protein [Mycolicibacterium flavescens]MCV7281793.1 DUF4878 domain-containing protein [Mycolicibacterium flavescens]ODQ90820.1 hypothetical protein BHQ18_08850 [Mycolicibacterium flavescens]